MEEFAPLLSEFMTIPHVGENDMARRIVPGVAAILLLLLLAFGGCQQSPEDGGAAALQKALALGEKGDLVAEREVLLKAVSRYPSHAPCFRELARVEDNLGMLQEALTHQQKAFELGDTDIPTFTQLFILYEFLGKPKEARALLDKLSRLKNAQAPPEGVITHLEVELLLNEASYDPRMRRRNLEKAGALLREIEEAKTADRCGGTCIVSAGEHAWLSGDYDKAIKSFELALKKGVSPMALRIDAMTAAAQLHLEAGHDKEATALFEQLVREVEAWNEPTYLRLSPVREVALLCLSVHYGRKFTPETVKALFPAYDELMKRGFADPFVNRRIREIAVLALAGDRSTALQEKCESLWEEHGKATVNPHVKCFYARNLLYPFMTVNLGIVLAECYDRNGLRDKAREEYRLLSGINPRDPVVRQRARK